MLVGGHCDVLTEIERIYKVLEFAGIFTSLIIKMVIKITANKESARCSGMAVDVLLKFSKKDGCWLATLTTRWGPIDHSQSDTVIANFQKGFNMLK